LQAVDFLLVVMDGRSGLIPEDRDIIRIAKETGRPFLLIVNKIDRVHEEDIAMAEFFEFGVDVVGASFEQRRGLAQILEWLHARLPDLPQQEKSGKTIAIVGKPNVGKSSLCNRLLGMHRMLVSDMAGTTVDSVDSPLVYNGKHYTLVDTAGLRRSSRREEDLEIISAFKSQESIRRADLVLLMIDATIGPTEQDAKILEAIVNDHRAVIIVANKTDLASKTIPEFRKKFREQIEREFHFFTDVRVVFTSAASGHGMDDLFVEIEHVAEMIDFRVSTSELNDFFFETIRKAPAPVWGTTNVKFYYLTQTYQKPPAFIAFANHPDGVSPSYRRFLIKNMKEHWNLQGLPIRIFCMKSRKGADKQS
jgi:GTP-binding protein